MSGRDWRDGGKNTRILQCALGALLVITIASRASAQAGDTATAASDYDTLIRQASDAYQAQQFEHARELFEQAHVLQPSARTLRGLGITAFALNNYVQARPELEASLVDLRKPLPREQRREVTEILEWMKQTLGTLKLELDPPHALPRIDDRAVGAGTNMLELGEHQLAVSASGFITSERSFLLERDHPLTLHIELQQEAVAPSARELEIAAPIPRRTAPEPLPSATESSSVFGRWWFWTLAGVVIAGTVVAVYAATYEPNPRALPSGVRLRTQ